MRDALRGAQPAPLPSGVWRDPTQPTPPPSFIPNADVTASTGPLQLSGSRPTTTTPAPPIQTPQPVAQTQTRTPRRDPIADLLPPASIPQPGVQQQRIAPAQQKGFFDKLFGG